MGMVINLEDRLKVALFFYGSLNIMISKRTIRLVTPAVEVDIPIGR